MMVIILLFLLIHQINCISYTVKLDDIDLDCLGESGTFVSLPIKILSFNIWTNELSIPGKFDLSFSMNITKKLLNDAYISTKLERKLGAAWIGFSSLAGIDACGKESLCGLIQYGCKKQLFTGRSNTVDNKRSHSCQLDLGVYTIPHLLIDIKRKRTAKIIKPITTGQYRLQLKFLDVKLKTTVGCATGFLTLLK